MMKVFCTTNRESYEIENSNRQQHCPVCSKDRKKSGLKTLSYDIQKGVGVCHHCNFTFVEWKDVQPLQQRVESREYKRPEKKELKIDLSENFIKWFAGRGISKQTLYEMKVTEQMEFMPQDEKEMNCICFNYFRDNELINVKYRSGNKHFKMVKDAELIPYNLDSVKGETVCIWVEGEMDQLSFFESGIKNVVSVPNGAGKNKQNLTYLDSCIDLLENISVHIIATDQDEPGRSLKDELIRRFSAENCKTVDFKDCKDANEYLIKYGTDELSLTIKSAKYVPLSGVYNVDENIGDIMDLWRNGMPRGLNLNHPQLNKVITWVSSALAIWTGIPSMGKSEMVDEVCEQLNILYGWKTAYYSPENWPIKTHIAKLVSRVSGKMFNTYQLNEVELKTTIDYVKDNFFVIHPEDDNVTIENILIHAKVLIKRNGIKCLVIDPWNKLDHKQASGESETQYISKALDLLTSFAQRNDILIHLVAHPTKIRKDQQTGKEPAPNLYDISGSAHFYNKAFYGLSVHRSDEFTELHVLKVKFRHLGEPRGGMIQFKYNINNGRYVEEFGQWDNNSHLIIEKQSPIEFYEPKEFKSADELNF